MSGPNALLRRSIRDLIFTLLFLALAIFGSAPDRRAAEPDVAERQQSTPLASVDHTPLAEREPGSSDVSR